MAEEIKREKELNDMFSIDKKTIKNIKKINSYYTDSDNPIEYFNKFFNLLHQDITNESKDRYSKYIVKHAELKNKLNEIFETKNSYPYKVYRYMFSDVLKQIEDNKQSYYGICDGLYKRIGKAKFLLDEDYCRGDELYKKLNKLKKYIIHYYGC